MNVTMILSKSIPDIFAVTDCKTVYEILQENGLNQYYQLEKNPGVSQKEKPGHSNYDFLENPEISKHLLSFFLRKLSEHFPETACHPLQFLHLVA